MSHPSSLYQSQLGPSRRRLSSDSLSTQHGHNLRLAELRAHARRMRFAPTESEWAFWQIVRSKRCGVLFRRQQVLALRQQCASRPRYGAKPSAGYGVKYCIADFLAPSVRLVVEVDGGYHAGRQRADRLRDRRLAECGYRVLRVSAEDVLCWPLEVRALVLLAVERAHQSQ